jgi:hypothetical protein
MEQLENIDEREMVVNIVQILLGCNFSAPPSTSLPSGTALLAPLAEQRQDWWQDLAWIPTQQDDQKLLLVRR